MQNLGSFVKGVFVKLKGLVVVIKGNHIYWKQIERLYIKGEFARGRVYLTVSFFRLKNYKGKH